MGSVTIRSQPLCLITFFFISPINIYRFYLMCAFMMLSENVNCQIQFHIVFIICEITGKKFQADIFTPNGVCGAQTSNVSIWRWFSLHSQTCLPLYAWNIFGVSLSHNHSFIPGFTINVFTELYIHAMWNYQFS